MAKVELLECGKIAEKYILQLNDFYEDITVEKYVIMPDHIHILLRVLDAEVGGASRTSPPTKQHSRVTAFVSTFKRFFNKEFGENIWQRSFYDHVIRDTKDYEEHINYVPWSEVLTLFTVFWGVNDLFDGIFDEFDNV